MKILGIRIRNLASLDGLTSIDFTTGPLSTAGIFAITGPTGAGKSTILDALCLALYGKTPRYLQAKEAGVVVADIQGYAINQGDVRGILRDGCAEGYAEVDFAAVDGHRYEARWKIRRAGSKVTGKLQDVEIAVRNLDTDAALTGHKADIYARIEQLVGLNFEQFTRSVLLAQGDFTAFLKAAKDDKSSLLEKLTGTQIYSRISQQIFTNHSRAKDALALLNAQREGIATLTVEELESLQSEKALLDERIAAMETEGGSLSKELEWHTLLTGLQSSIASAETQLENARQEKLLAADREKQLRLVERVQPTREWINSQERIVKKAGSLRDSLRLLHSELQGLNATRDLRSSEELKAAETRSEKQRESQDAKPLLHRARALDVQIGERSSQLDSAEQEAAGAREIHVRDVAEVTKLEWELKQLSLDIEALKDWKDGNAAYQSVAENLALIKARLRDGEAAIDAMSKIRPQLESADRQLITEQKKHADLDLAMIELAGKIIVAEASKTTAEEAIAGIGILELESGLTDVTKTINTLTSGEASWKVYRQLRTELESLNARLEADRSAFAGKSQQLVAAAATLHDSKTARDVSQRLLNKARLAAGERVETLRRTLVTDEPCPVCGSTEHPYVTENPALDHVLEELERSHLLIDEQYTAALTLHSGLQEAVNQLLERIPGEEAALAAQQINCEAQQREWAGSDCFAALASIPEDEHAAWFRNSAATAGERREELRQQHSAFTEKKRALDEHQKNLLELEQLKQSNAAVQKDLQHTIETLSGRCAQYRKEDTALAESLAGIDRELTAYVPGMQSFGEWKQDPGGFGLHIDAAATTWNENTRKLESDLQTSTRLRHSLSTATERAAQSSEEAAKRKIRADEISDALNALRNERLQIFGGASANAFETAMNEAVEAATDALAAIQADREKLELSIGKAQTQQQVYETEAGSLQEEGAELGAQIQSWLSTYNADSDTTLTKADLARLLSFGTEWIRDENAALRAIDEKLAATQTILTERTNRLAEHKSTRPSEREMEELSALLAAVKTEMDLAAESRTGIGFRLRQHHENTRTIAGLLEQIEAKRSVAESWGQLNEVIGSADGKKFRQIAQEYTLDVLLDYANVHLEMLSKRYLLQRIPGTLALQVLDRDMGDEIRTVFSLSGGESFLVSLALALGLASLSSNRMQVESLFIDEGFGSLDPATLNIAMDALERLHNQGRKVGVISHVQEMTERIPVQIRVSKQASGKSKVEIVG